MPWSPALVLADGGGDLGGLFLDGDDDAAAFEPEAILGLRVADVADDVAGDLGVVDVVPGGDPPRMMRSPVGRHLQATCLRIVGDDLVQNGVGDLIAELVRVASVTLSDVMRRRGWT
jgi:hypothetical protein